MTDLKNQVALITGGGSGIGRVIAVGLAERGVMVCLVGRRAHLLESMAQTIQAMGQAAKIYPADITSDGSVRSLSHRVEKELGRLNILVHSAGMFSMGELSTSSTGDFSAQYYTNVYAPLCLTQSLLPLIRRHRGQVVFINSTMALTTRSSVGHLLPLSTHLKLLLIHSGMN